MEKSKEWLEGYKAAVVARTPASIRAFVEAKTAQKVYEQEIINIDWMKEAKADGEV